MRFIAGSLAALLLASCAPDIDIDPGEDTPTPIDGPTVEFDPSNSIVPFPTNLLLDPATGLVNLPEQCNESATQTALRELVLNQLDGFGTYKTALQVTFTEAVDPASLTDRIVLYRRATGMTPVDPAAAVTTPIVVIPGQQERDAADCSGSTPVDNVTIVPLAPLVGGSTYTVALLAGITTMDGGEAYLPSSTWGFVRQSTNPVTVENGAIVAERTPFDPVLDIETLLGIDLLWNAHAGALAFLDGAEGAARTDILLAWDFNTQSTTTIIDPAVAGSVGSMTPSATVPGFASILGGATPTQFMEAQLGPVIGGQVCQNLLPPPIGGPLPCQAIGDIVATQITAPRYQIDTPNPLAGGDMVPGPWADPRSPAKVADEAIAAISFVPAMPAPPEGYPVVVFGHGLTRSQNDLLVIGSQLAAVGFASIAINWVAHGDRAVQVSDNPAIGCGPGPLDPTALPQCFAPIVSSDLPATRDNARQSALDALTLIETIKACGPSACPGHSFDPDRIGYMGQSLGGILGTIVTQISPDIKASVINVGGASFLDVAENTDSLGIKCPLVDALIDAGVLSGDKFNPVAGTGLCTDDGWLTQPGYVAFAAAARWVLDPGDPINFAPLLAGAKPVLLQEVIDDEVVPNVATANLGALFGLGAMAADAATGAIQPIPASAAITTDPNDPKFVQYTTLPPDVNTGFPGNNYSHGSLLAPASADAAGSLGTGQMQTDAITFLFLNL